MMKRWCKALTVSVLIAGLLLAPFSSSEGMVLAASAATEKKEELQLWVDGSYIKLSAPIYKENNNTLVPMKDLLEALGVSFVFEKKSNTVIIRDGGQTITMSIGKKEAIVNGKSVKLSAASTLSSGVVYVPVRFVAEQLDATVEWDGTANAVKVKSWYYIEKAQDEDIAYEKLEKLTAADIVAEYDESIIMISTNRGFGSGIVIADNLILTNYHVMVDATSATVKSIYGDEFIVNGVVVSNKNTDLAIIQTKTAMELQPIEISYDYLASKGDRVFAIGSPLAIQNTVSEGLISNLSHENGVSYIQTNAQIDHGSSGGALFNEYGELVGINYAGISRSRADLNFAIEAFHAASLIKTMTDEHVENVKFLTPTLPDTLAGAPLSDIQKLLKAEYGSVQTEKGSVEFSKWEVERDSEGWLVLTADIDPIFYLYYGAASAGELRIWTVNLGHELHRMLPEERIQVLISFERDYHFQPRGLSSSEVTYVSDGKWRVRYPVINMQLIDQLYIETRM